MLLNWWATTYNQEHCQDHWEYFFNVLLLLSAILEATKNMNLGHTLEKKNVS